MSQLLRALPWWLAVRVRLSPRQRRGFTVVEVLMAVAIVGILAAIGMPSYQSYLDRRKTVQAIADIRQIEMALTRYAADNRAYPPGDTGLAAINWTAKDPWGNDYQYLSMEGASVGKKRKDKSLHPLNSDFDLYSLGADGKSSTPLTAKASQDDIIRANDGAFIGLGQDY